ncbi:2-iminobutanoate/2-iminopropanoate deaminase-like [Ylistrum balloti]|uniref:2-iminobutanoate/2-iminopropanoate deaminase-like n=1 Tax=Ylistrum balloti TaxID=509963 RepID=UPI002905E404|nr:2-iminobutanoate/2-iminopropanoate deaminase-like [Ylistrum balloti]
MAGVVRKIIQTSNAPAAIGSYSQAVRVDHTLYISGQIGLKPTTGVMVEGGVIPETQQVMKNMGAILEAAGASFDNVVKATVMLEDINDFTAVNTEYAKNFTKNFPARALVQVAALPRGAKVEIEAVAVVGPITDES